MFGLYRVHFDYYRYEDLVCVSKNTTLLEVKALELWNVGNRYNVGLIKPSEEDDNHGEEYFVILPIEELV